MRPAASAGVAETGGDAVDGGGDGAVELAEGWVVFFGGGFGEGAFLAEEVDLKEGEGVDVGVAEADGAGQDGVGFEQFGLGR